MRQYNTLIHLSGGQDSTYALWDRLTRFPKELILIHHVNLKHIAENRYHQEKTAVKRILSWLKQNKLTNWSYHESEFHYGSLPNISIKDIQIVALFTGIILRSRAFPGIKTLVLPWHLGEVDSEEIRRGYRVRAMLQALEAPEVQFDFPLMHLSRTDMAAKMPADLLALCHFCRKPSDTGSCGHCRTCHEYKEANIFHANI